MATFDRLTAVVVARGFSFAYSSIDTVHEVETRRQRPLVENDDRYCAVIICNECETFRERGKEVYIWWFLLAGL